MNAIYYDGLSAKRSRVEISFGAACLTLEGEGVQLKKPYAETEALEKIPGGPRTLAFKDDGWCEIQHPEIDAILRQLGFKTHWIEKLHHKWYWALTAGAAAIASLTLSYFILLPLLSQFMASTLPPSLIETAGNDALKILDQHVFKPSSLPVLTQNRLRQKLNSLYIGSKMMPSHLEFRSSTMGPNAFALPNGTIVLTDELYYLLDDEQATLGALAHELGHIKNRHLLRKTLQTGIVGLTSALLFGDTSIILAGFTSTVLDLSYNRDFEREADQFAIKTFQENHLPLEKLVALHEKLKNIDDTHNHSTYLNSHPESDERIRMVQQAKLVSSRGGNPH
jgi:Zn-dependent protease with chaperone function